MSNPKFNTIHLICIYVRLLRALEAGCKKQSQESNNVFYEYITKYTYYLEGMYAHTFIRS